MVDSGRAFRLFGVVAALIVLGGTAASAQTLPDLQPGRNFSGANNFGANRSENIDAGDVDNDGDMDVGVANGGDGAAEPNRLFINLGGLQGGTTGAFAEETSTRFAGVAIDTSRDIEFVDVDGDADLDVHIANRGTTANGGEPGRFYTNLGGVQGGTIGFFQEDTNLRWGTLASVPLGQQVFGENVGPFRDYSCDCDFGDLDDDGDSDLFHSSYGPASNGTRNSLVFLNDGAGVFHELFPWANPGADIQTHTFDMDLTDLDGDFDLDVVTSSLNSQARVYMNNLYNPIGATLFEDTTQWSLLTNQTGNNGNALYETEYADADGDGDFDLWMVNYNNLAERLFRNDGFTPGSGTSFTRMNAWIKGDPNVDELEADFIDYDGDGDLDVYMANFAGTNYLYQSGLAQGLHYDVAGLYHRTGVGTGLAPGFELPQALNGGTTLDGDTADVDNDGDEDILVANDGGQQNVLVTNVLGVPDTHAPSFYMLTQVAAAVPNGQPQVIHAQIRDNSAFYITNFYATMLHVSVNGGADVATPMFAQGSMQFRGVIPAQTDAEVAYFVECTDLAGNTSLSDVTVFTQGTVPSPWSDLGSGLAGVSGVPALSGTGTLIGGSPLSIDLTNAKPGALAGLLVSVVSVPVPFHGGTISAFPPLPGFPLVLPTGAGSIPLALTIPAGVNGVGLHLFFQYAIPDAAAVEGYALSNALEAAVP
ncbi:MAG: VCBS repeat-containing protein [Cytophagaceae bacterium]|nr:VCBS repeat-containing protein [Gemmatimonadaceae bacterium]